MSVKIQLFATIVFLGHFMDSTLGVGGDPHGAFTISAADLLPPCETIRETRTFRGRLIELPGPKNIVGYRCLVQFTQMDTRKSVISTVEIVNREVCLTAHKTKIMELDGNRVVVDPNGTVTHPVPILHSPKNEPLKMSNNYDRTYVIKLSTHTGIVDFEKDVVNFDLGVGCDFSRYACQKDHLGQIFWTPEIYSDLRREIFSGSIIIFTRDKIRKFNTYGPSLLGIENEVTYAVINGSSVMKVHPFNLDSTSLKNAFWADHPDRLIDITNEDIYFTNQQNTATDTVDSDSTHSRIINEHKSAMDAVKDWCSNNELKFLQDHLSDILGKVKTVQALRDTGTVPDVNLDDIDIRFSTSTDNRVIGRQSEKYSDESPTRFKSRQKRGLYLWPYNSKYSPMYGSGERTPCVEDKPPPETFDWVKAILIVFVCLWGLTTLLYFVFIKLIPRCKSEQFAEQPQHNDQDRPTVVSKPWLSFKHVLKPPCFGKYPPKQNGETGEPTMECSEIV